MPLTSAVLERPAKCLARSRPRCLARLLAAAIRAARACRPESGRGGRWRVGSPSRGEGGGQLGSDCRAHACSSRAIAILATCLWQHRKAIWRGPPQRATLLLQTSSAGRACAARRQWSAQFSGGISACYLLASDRTVQTVETVHDSAGTQYNSRSAL